MWSDKPSGLWIILAQSHLVQEVLKGNYDFGFATVDHEPFEERELEDTLTSDVTSYKIGGTFPMRKVPPIYKLSGAFGAKATW